MQKAKKETTYRNIIHSLRNNRNEGAIGAPQSDKDKGKNMDLNPKGGDSWTLYDRADYRTQVERMR